MEIIQTLFICIFAMAAVSANVQDTCLSSHNKLRELHANTPSMTWSDSIATGAKSWANHLASTRLFYHDANRRSVGENIYRGCGPAVKSCAEAAMSWYSEYKWYSYKDPLGESNGVIGHFTQMAWKGSRELGAGIATYLDGSNICTVIVARYSPPGNVNSNQYYIDNIGSRIPEKKMPSKYDLDPSLCNDASGDKQCKSYESAGFCQKTNQYYKYMDFHCAKTCNIC